MISTARRAIQTANEAGRDTVAAYEDLNRAVLRVAEMAIGGNAFIHEARHKAPELRAAIEQAEMRQQLRELGLERRRIRRMQRNEGRERVRAQVVHPRDRHAPGQSEALRRGQAHGETGRQSGAVCDHDF